MYMIMYQRLDMHLTCMTPGWDGQAAARTAH
jgi:hypothetical protein